MLFDYRYFPIWIQPQQLLLSPRLSGSFCCSKSVRFHWQLQLLLRFCRIHTTVAGCSDSIIRPRFSKRRIGNQEVCQPARRYGKPDKCNTEARCKNQSNRQTDRKVYHISYKKWTHDSKSTQNSIRCHLNAHENKEIANPSHVIPGYLICESSSVFSQK